MFTILIVDDTPEYLTLLSKLLMPDYNIRAASSGARALEIAVSDPRPDLILLDIVMPEMNGYQVLKQLQDDERTANIPVIFITALDNSVDQEHGYALGAVDFITKPFKPAKLLKQIKAAQEKKSAHPGPGL